MAGEKSSLSVTVDIEDWYHIPSVTGSQFSRYSTVDEFFDEWDDRYDYLTEPTNRVLALLDNYNIRATFFVVADVVEHYPGLVESIVDRGHEIACHGLHHACNIDSQTKKPLINQEDFEQRTQKAKNILEKVSGEKVVGYRAPNALIGGWMLDSLENLGFKYDSSVCVNSLYNKSDSSLQNISSYPYHPQSGSLEPGGTKKFVEFPWAYWNLLGIKVPTSGGPMLRFLGSHVILKGLQQSIKRGHTIFYFHPLDISEGKFPNIGNKRPLYWIIKGKLVENRVHHIIKLLKNKNVTVKPIRDILE